MVAGAVPVQRGCGFRQAGGIYAELGVGPNGVPVEAFLIDPPQVLTFKVGAQGMTGFIDPDDPSTMHLIDWVGHGFYPNVADFIEEVRRFGLSRRLPPFLDWNLITPKSRIYSVHALACNMMLEFRDSQPWHCIRRDLRNEYPAEVFARLPDMAKKPPCPDGATDPACAGFWWYDIDPSSGVEYVNDTVPPEARRQEPRGYKLAIRQMPSFSYQAHVWDGGFDSEGYEAGFFAVWPLTRLAVVEGGNTQGTLEMLEGVTLPVEVVDA